MNLTAEKISKQFFRKRKDSNVFFAVNETDFELEEAKLTVLCGKSGSGKSTLLNMLSGILAPSGGSIFLSDPETGEKIDIYSLNDDSLSRLRNKHYGVIPQGQTALHSLTVLENVIVPYNLYENESRKNSEYDFEAVRQRALMLLKRVGIEELADVMPGELSGGELRRMSIARALIMKPDIIFADEPTEDLDDSNTEAVLKLLREISGEGRSVMMVTHDKDAFEYADIIYKMKNGSLERCDLPE